MTVRVRLSPHWALRTTDGAMSVHPDVNGESNSSKSASQLKTGFPFSQTWLHPSLLWAVLIAGILTTWMDFAGLQRLANSDSLIPVFASLVRFSPFLWGQNRYGMFIPLLASFIHSPFANLLFQGWISAFAGFLASFLLLRYATGSGPTWLVAGAIVNLTAFCVVPLLLQWDWFCNQPYGLSLALAFSAFITLERASKVRWTLGIVLMLLAHWVNITLPMLLVPLVVLHYLIDKQKSDLERLLPCISAGVLGGWLLMRTAPYSGSTAAGFIPISEWPSAWMQMFRVLHTAMLPLVTQWLIWLIPAVAALILSVTLPSFRLRRHFRLAAALGTTAIINWFLIGTFHWVQLNHYWPRYTYAAMLFGIAGLAVLEAPLLEGAVGSKRALAILAAAMFATIVAQYGSPSLERARHDVDERFGRMTDEILATRATVIAGNYWTVWPAVFHANQVLHDQGRREIVYGLTYRSSVSDALWADTPKDQLCVAAPRGDAEARKYMNDVKLKLTQIESHDTLDLFKLSDQSACRQSSQTATPSQWISTHLHPTNR